MSSERYEAIVEILQDAPDDFRLEPWSITIGVAQAARMLGFNGREVRSLIRIGKLPARGDFIREKRYPLSKEELDRLPLSEVVATLLSHPAPSSPPPAPRSVKETATAPPPEPEPIIDLESQALALLIQRDDWSVAQIAKHLGVDRKTPYKWKKFRIAAERVGKMKPHGPKGRNPRRGHKTRDGRVEAYQDEDEDE